MPRCARRNAGSAAASTPSSSTRPACTGSSPSSVRISVVLPMPLRPIRPIVSPRMHGEIDAAQYLAGAVAGDDAARLQDRRAHTLVPEIGVAHRGRGADCIRRAALPARGRPASPSCGPPRRTPRPCRAPPAARRDRAPVRAAVPANVSLSSGPMPASGSSSSSTFGCAASATPISSWRSWPWLSVPAMRSATSARPTRAMRARAAVMRRVVAAAVVRSR